MNWHDLTISFEIESTEDKLLLIKALENQVFLKYFRIAVFNETLLEELINFLPKIYASESFEVIIVDMIIDESTNTETKQTQLKKQEQKIDKQKTNKVKLGQLKHSKSHMRYFNHKLNLFLPPKYLIFVNPT